MLRIQPMWALLFLLTACGGGGHSNSAPPPVTLASITVTPTSPSIAKGLTQQLSAKGTFTDGSTSDVTSSASWSSATASVASVDTHSGLATSLAVGSTVITATSGSVSASVTLLVTPAVVESIVISPNPAYAGIGINRQLTATGTYSDGSTADVSTLATWTSTNTSIATVEPETGLVTAGSLGSTSVAASIGSVVSSVPLSVVSQVWTPTGNPKFFHVANPAVLLPSGQVLVAGSYECRGDAGSKVSETYDYVHGTWTPTGSMVQLVCPQSLTLLANGKVLALGVDSTQSVPVAEIYDPVPGTWSTTASPLQGQVDATATLLQNGNVLLAGGSDATNAPTAATQIYDPTVATWVASGSMSAPRITHTATLLSDGRVLLAGGQTGAVGGLQPSTGTSEIYDPSTGLSSAVATMSVSRNQHTATALPDGRVFVAGGMYFHDFFAAYALYSAEIYDPTAGTWSSTGEMTGTRLSHTATLMPSGQVLLTGGWQSIFQDHGSGRDIPDGAQSSTEIYVPATAKSGATGSMAAERAAHAAVLLPNGSVLVVGEVQYGPIQQTAELYW